MKKYLVCFFFVLCVFLFSGCDLQQMQQEQQQNFQQMQQEQQQIQYEQQEKQLKDSMYIYTDPETGVQYICFYYKRGYAGMGGITPRLNSDGSLMVVDDEAS